MADDVLDHYGSASVSGERLGPRVPLDREAAELLERIKHAFADWPPNAGLTWVQGEMLDNYEPDEVVREGARIGAYERWQDVPPELFAAFPSAVWFLDDAGLSFYWPALMTWELQYGPTFMWHSPAETLLDCSDRLRPQTQEQSQVFAAYKDYIKSHRQGRGGEIRHE